MTGRKRFSWYKFSTISMVVIGVGFFLLSVILPRFLWRDENLGLNEPEKKQATDTVGKRTSNPSVPVSSSQQVAQLTARLESWNSEDGQEDEIADESSKTPIDEGEELIAEEESLLENSGSEHEPVDSTGKEQKPKYNLYDHAPEGFEDYVQYDRSLGIDQLPSRWPSEQKQRFIEDIQQYSSEAWIFYHPYNMNTFVYMGHLH